MGPVARQVDHHQAIQSILCCAYITTITVIFFTGHQRGEADGLDEGFTEVGECDWREIEMKLLIHC